MSLQVNLRHLEKHTLRLQGEVPVDDLDMEGIDELIRVSQPLKYDVEVQKLDQGILAQGRLELTVDCECARCLRPFRQQLQVADWTCHLALEGEEAVPVVNDCVDLTPYLREDILLEFPQHPLCKAECGGLPKKAAGKKKITGGTGQTEDVSSAWAELNKLKF
jgi:uncharacterized protein